MSEVNLVGLTKSNEEYCALRKAANELYLAGRWSCSNEVDEALLWSNLRDALQLEVGTATNLGIGN